MGTGRPPTYTWLYVDCQAACAARVRVLPASPRAPHTVRRCPCSARERRARGGGAGADSGRRGPPAWAGAHICDVRLYARNAQVYSIPRVCLVALPCGGQRGVHNVFIKSAKRYAGKAYARPAACNYQFRDRIAYDNELSCLHIAVWPRHRMVFAFSILANTAVKARVWLKMCPHLTYSATSRTAKAPTHAAIAHRARY